MIQYSSVKVYLLIIRGMRTLLPRLPVFFLLACAAVARLPLAHADLLLPQGAHNNPHRSQWGRVFERIPSRLRPVRDVVVREVSDAEMDRLVRDDSEGEARIDDSVVDGMFFVDDGQPTIVLRRSLAGEDAVQVFAHELGHAVWDTQLSAAERRRFVSAYRRARAAARLVTEYAGESASEGFAEAYAFFVLKPAVLKRRDPLSFAVLESLRTGSR